MNICIPTGNRNKHINRCTNLWSMFVLIGLVLGVAGALLMALSTQKITDRQFKKVKEQIDMLNRIGSGDPDLTPDEVVYFLESMPQELKDQVGQSMPGGEIKPEFIQQAFAQGYGCDPADMAACADTMPDDMEYYEAPTTWEDQWDDHHPVAAEGAVCEECIWDEETATCIEWVTVECGTMMTWDEPTFRRRLFGGKGMVGGEAGAGGFPRSDDMDKFEKYQKAGLLALMIVGIVGPILTTIGMIFFCCQLKALADDHETACESCCGALMGCFVFPVVFVVGFVLSLLAALFMNFMCTFLTAPFLLTDLMMQMRVAAGDAYSAKDPAALTPMFNQILPLMKDSAMTLMNGSLCEDSYLMREVLTEADGKNICTGWLMSYRFGMAAQIIAAVFSMFGVLITVYVGYKACCRNNRDVKTDVEMA